MFEFLVICLLTYIAYKMTDENNTPRFQLRQVINCLHDHNPLINKPLKKVSVEEGVDKLVDWYLKYYSKK